MRIETVKQGASGTAIVVAGGSSFIFRPAQVEELGLSAATLLPGTELGEDAALLLVTAAEAYEAEKKAIALLARAEQSTYMLSTKLESRGFSKKAVLIALERLAAEGILSDSRFAEAYAAARLSRRAEGPASLVVALRARGVNGDAAKAAVAAVLGPGERAAALAKAAAKELRRSGRDKRNLERRLRALGFKSDEIAEALSKC